MMRMLDEGAVEYDRVGKGDAGSTSEGAVVSRAPSIPARPSFPLTLGCALVVWAVAAALFFVTYHPDNRAFPILFSQVFTNSSCWRMRGKAISDSARWLASIMRGNLTMCAFSTKDPSDSWRGKG